jgi:hypothetical protein
MGLDCKDHVIEVDPRDIELLKRLKFFNDWVQYYFYSADHLFLRHLFNPQSGLLSLIIDPQVSYKERLMMRPKVQQFISLIQSHMDAFIQGDFPSPSKHFSYVVPVRRVSCEEGGHRLVINMGMIERVIKHTKKRLYNLLWGPSF